MPETIVPGRPLPLTFNFYNTTQDVKVKADLIRDSHHLVSTANFTFMNGRFLLSCNEHKNSLKIFSKSMSFLSKRS